MENTLETKQCTKCNTTKSIKDNFTNSDYWCNTCKSDYQKARLPKLRLDRQREDNNYKSYQKAYQKQLRTNPNYKSALNLRIRVLNSVNRFLLTGKEPIQRQYTSEANQQRNTVPDLLGCTVKEYVKHLSKTAIDNGYTDFDIYNYSSKSYNVDHIFPTSSFDLTDLKQQRTCFNFINTQILRTEVNIAKSNIVTENEVKRVQQNINS